MSTVFISYSQKDKEVAAKVKASLEASDIKGKLPVRRRDNSKKSVCGQYCTINFETTMLLMVTS